ncbi:KH domain-containing protein [Acorus calamus]|uniref:KH domain-containing protein n=1 Tax=Acorus calamus TaxID=4465 RepID=A0AAV9DU43_ACOCL|nr:KH domain-containing protein [Acorus calamus]
MGETNKRPRNQRDSDSGGRHQKQKSYNKWGNSDEGELVVYRILCPGSVIGSVIGKSGKVINALRQDTRAKIKVVDPFPGVDERVITIYCYVKDKDPMDVDEDGTEPLCPAQDALIKVYAAIANAVANANDSDRKRKEEVRILVPSSQAANIIGKSGMTIKKLRSKTRANIKVAPKDPSDPTQSCAMSFDNFIQITGDSEAVKRALFAVSAIMYKFSPKEEISLDASAADLPPSIIIPSDVPIYPATGFYPSTEAIIPPPRSVPSVMSTTPHVSELHGYTDSGSAWPVYTSALPMVSGFGGSSPSEELIVRVLCPSDKIGRVIGKGGSSIKNVRQASGACIDVDDKKSESEECIITISATEAMDSLKSAAIEAVLLLQEKINDEDDDTVYFRLLVPTKVIGCLIGKGGSIINEMRKHTRASIRISKGEKPKCANDEDELVEVNGEVSSVRDALVQIVLRLRADVLKERESGHSHHAPMAAPLYPSGPLPSTTQTVPPIPPLSYDQRVEPGSGLGMLSSGSIYDFGPLQVGGDSVYESFPSYTTKLYAGMPSEMVIPASAVGKVMGKGGANLANIRQISGAHVEVIDSKTSRDRIAQISGTPEQKRSAENLIQAFIMAT